MIRHIGFVFVLLSVLGLLSVQAAVGDCLFVNTNSKFNTVAAFAVSPDGSLVPAPGSPFPTGGEGGFNADVGSVALSVTPPRLYVTNSRSASLSGFDVASDCSLTALPGSPYTTGWFPAGVDFDPTDDFVYVSNFFDYDISVYAVAENGSLVEIPGSPFPTTITPLDLQFHPTDPRFFVSHDFDGSVGVYDQAPDGSFLPVADSPFPAGGTQHGLGLDRSGSRLYVTDLTANTVTGYSVGDGGLIPLAPSTYSTGLTPIELVLDVADRFLYVTHNQGNTIGGFAVGHDGDLTPLPGSPFPSDSLGPAGLAQDPRGRLLFVANGGFAGRPDVSVYVVAADGTLAPIAGSPFPTGGTGQATGIAYLRQSVDLATIPTLDGLGLGLLAVCLLLCGIALLRWPTA